MSLIRVFDGSDWILSSAQTAQASEVAWFATYAEESGFADNAQADASGNDIEETYATKSELPTVPVQSVNGQTGAVVLNIPTVPTNISAFTNDAGYITMADITMANGVSF